MRRIAALLFAVGAFVFLAAPPVLSQLQPQPVPKMPFAVSIGGTGDTGTAWTAYTPTLSAGSGTFTTASATGIWKSIGKTVFFQVTITITTNGTAAGFVVATLPISAATASISIGRETALTGKGLVGTIFGGGVSASYYDNTYPGGNGASIIVCGIYQST